VLFGGGVAGREGWINLDILSATTPLDLRNEIPLEDESVSHGYAAFVLEHFFYPEEAKRFLSEVYRLLRPGGILRIVVPNADWVLRQYVDPHTDDDWLAGQWVGDPQYYSSLSSLLFYLGCASTVAEFTRTHKFAYNFDTLEALCRGVGFSAVYRSFYRDKGSPLGALDEGSEGCGGLLGRQDAALFVDVTKPQ
jgi:predicted SAM-dependent methyltransferase